jgi:hypothetical protein
MNQRKHPRVAVGLQVACIFTLPTAKSSTATWGTAYDISLSGMKVSIPIPVPLRRAKVLSYHLELPTPFSEITGEAQIKWARRSPDRRNILLGVEFNFLTPQQWADLQTIIQELLAAEAQ